MNLLIRLPSKFSDYLAGVIALAVFIGLVGFGAVVSIGYRMGERKATADLSPVIDSNASEIAVLHERIMYIQEAFTFQGVASWYGDKEHGRVGANNKRFDKFARTMATKFLPFHSMKWRVTRLDTGATTVLESTDDGPNVPGRLFDLSYQAAVDLDMIEAGTVDVEISPEI